MLTNFSPFNSAQFNALLDEVRKLPENYRPDNNEIPPTLRGYAEIERLYRAICFDGRRGPNVKMISNPRSEQDAAALNALLSDFRGELETFAEDHGIHRDGYSVCVLDRSLVLEKSECQYFLLVEVLDGKLHPALLGPACVDSFITAPVAFLVGSTPNAHHRFALPIFTSLAFREVIQRLATTPLRELQQTPTPSHGFALLCDAIAKAKTPPALLDCEQKDPFLSVNAYSGRPESGIELMNIPCEIEAVSHAIQEIVLKGSYLSPTFLVSCVLEGWKEEFQVTFSRNSRWGSVAAVAVLIEDHSAGQQL